MYRCCIFDLDGTLVNTLSALCRSVNLTMDQFGLDHIDREQTRKYVGDGAKMLVERSLKACGDPEAAHLEEAYARYMEIFKDCCLYEVEAYDGIRELLEYLRKKEIKTAVLSNKPHERTLDTLEAVFGSGVFDWIAGEQPGVRRKPDPAGVFNILEGLEVRPEECLYFGDTNTDMRTGGAAGLDTVAVTWGFRDQEELTAFHPRYLIHHPSEIYPAFEEARE